MGRKLSCHFLVTFNKPKPYDGLLGASFRIYIPLLESPTYPLIYLNPEKGTLFRTEPPRVGYYRECPLAC